jgi:hypothetical protein
VRDLHARLLALQVLGLGLDLRAGREEAGHPLGGAVDQLVEAQRGGVVVGEVGVQLLGVLAQVALARVVVGAFEVLREHVPMLCEREEGPAPCGALSHHETLLST